MYLTIKTAVFLFCLTQLFSPWKNALAQNQGLYAIQTLPLEVSESRTLMLSFPAAVKSLDRGSAELLAQKAKGTENVVLLKAAHSQIQPTSLIVITTDGDIHTFEVQYQQRPSVIGLQIMPKHHQPAAAQLPGATDQNQIQQAISLAAAQKSNLNRKAASGGFSATVEGVYVCGPLMCIRLSLENRSVIDYDTQTLSVLTRDKKQIKRTASQQQLLPLIGSSAAAGQIKASEQKTVILAVAKTTLPRSKNLVIQLIERSGARHLDIKMTAKDLSKIAAIPKASNL